MNHLDLFSGIGGFALAAKWVWGDNHNIVSFVEIDKFCQKVLKKHWPNVPCHDDIRTYKHNGTAIDLVTGGWPCQPFSTAGKQQGARDDRFLWPEMLAVIRQVRPTWVISENVAQIAGMVLTTMLSDLEGEGYRCQTFLIPACSQNAPHKRERAWTVGALGNPKYTRWKKQPNVAASFKDKNGEKDRISFTPSYDVSNAHCLRELQQKGSIKDECGWAGNSNWWETEPNMGRVAHGVPDRVDRLRSLGNAIVPQVVVPIMQAIQQIEESSNIAAT